MTIKRLQALKAKKGFTLVELIVVIAIIAILAAILIPILVNHIQSSRCSAAIGDAKSASNAVSEVVADSITEGKTVQNAIADGMNNDLNGLPTTGYTVTVAPAAGAAGQRGKVTVTVRRNVNEVWHEVVDGDVTDSNCGRDRCEANSSP